MFNPSSNLDIALSTTSSLMNDVAAASGVDSKNPLSSDSDGSNARHRNPSGDAQYAVAMDDAPHSTDLRGSHTNCADSTADVPATSPNHHAETDAGPFARRSSSYSPDRYRVAKTPSHISFSTECDSKSPKLPGGITAGSGESPRPCALSKSPERAGTVGSACERLRASVSPDRRVGQARALEPPTAAVKSPSRMARLSPERPAQKREVGASPDAVCVSSERLSVSSEYLHRSPDRIRHSQERRRVSPGGPSSRRSRPGMPSSTGVPGAPSRCDLTDLSTCRHVTRPPSDSIC